MKMFADDTNNMDNDWHAAGVCCGVFFRRHVQEKIGWLDQGIGCEIISFAYIHYKLQVTSYTPRGS